MKLTRGWVQQGVVGTIAKCRAVLVSVPLNVITAGLAQGPRIFRSSYFAREARIADIYKQYSKVSVLATNLHGLFLKYHGSLTEAMDPV